MVMYVSQRRANARLRRKATSTANPLTSSGAPLSKLAWTGGRLDITGTSIDFTGSEPVAVRQSGSYEKTKQVEVRLSVPLVRVSGVSLGRGMSGARYLALDIDDGSQLQIRPTELDDTNVQLQAALRAAVEETEA